MAFMDWTDGTGVGVAANVDTDLEGGLANPILIVDMEYKGHLG